MVVDIEFGSDEEMEQDEGEDLGRMRVSGL
jgi:hypothetical protein